MNNENQREEIDMLERKNFYDKIMYNQFRQKTKLNGMSLSAAYEAYGFIQSNCWQFPGSQYSIRRFNETINGTGFIEYWGSNNQWQQIKPTCPFSFTFDSLDNFFWMEYHPPSNDDPNSWDYYTINIEQFSFEETAWVSQKSGPIIANNIICPG